MREAYPLINFSYTRDLKGYFPHRYSIFTIRYVFTDDGTYIRTSNTNGRRVSNYGRWCTDSNGEVKSDHLTLNSIGIRITEAYRQELLAQSVEEMLTDFSEKPTDGDV